MTVVIDTNVILTARVVGHRNHPIFLALATGRIILVVSVAILLEWEEIVTARASADQWRKLSRTIDLASELSGNIRVVEPSFHFHLITADPDDDKFADCAIAANADYLVTEDAHFDAIKSAGYSPRVITPQDFIALL